MLRTLRHPRRVVITGMGCVTPIGIGREAFWSSLIAGVSGIRRIERFDPTGSPVRIAAEVRDFDWEAQNDFAKRTPPVIASAWLIKETNLADDELL